MNAEGAAAREGPDSWLGHGGNIQPLHHLPGHASRCGEADG